ncbi:Ubiquitin-conjugating enzyme E2 6 [Polyrhizophydium stewartii]|uniref:Ubiquitin-conjugating enzyme E2 6 n=1 Tax=Polyrhizophydium stewartii TaxID=2732419 RepID=A0ABR4NI25_9FUNG
MVGRFETNFRLCLSMSDYHPNTWNPAWSVSTILTGMLSFMLEDEPTTGSIVTTPAEKRLLAKKSRQWNSANQTFRGADLGGVC